MTYSDIPDPLWRRVLNRLRGGRREQLTEDDIQKPTMPVSRWRRVLLWGVIPACVVALLTYGIGWFYPDASCDGPFDDLTYVDGECVGATDGGYVFDPAFAKIEKRIKDENDWVARQHDEAGKPAFKVAMLSTLTTSDDTPLNRNQVRSALEGAYVAQHRANHTRGAGDTNRLVQLVLVNEGGAQQGSRYAVDHIIDLAEDSDADIPLSIVMGQAIGTKQTTEAAKRLSANDIPMVGATVTANDLDFAHVDGLLRTAPSNDDFARAFEKYLDGQDKLKSAVLTYDSTKSDTFASTLAASFRDRLGKHIEFSDQPFPGGSVETGGAEVFYSITQNVCSAHPDMVMFAGRRLDLDSFLESLSERICSNEHLTILFTDVGLHDSSQGTKKLEKSLKDANLTLLQATSYDPTWIDTPEAAPDGFGKFLEQYEGLIGTDTTALDNGYGVNNHDAMLAAIKAVRIANPGQAEPPLPSDVRDHLLLLNGVNAVRGATGTLSFNANRGGNPGGKFVPVIPIPTPKDYDPKDTYKTPID
ncbi:ABC transporter substrate-binding protein [Stackebrandtia nassauensis]|uniref:Extracellular ligand-binding receptor n=1 Tax=Stackebrandtia nassauensis (strain DSM 44728 / CIP 108903 / NRRL B-16338 / NBRC 102104 / LLR-40K-21) TaxID=446470 RepID=D3PXT0_STANL|nr:ABC transporter substrate-binding protein [Stackebrandtia nassauensis]ADD43410.1 Extracellular ligand-binding receptor [Stackebrandtia nassauensis DSM 44728]